MLNYITWDLSPTLFSIGNFSLRWYSLLLSLGFIIGYLILQRIFKNEGVSEKDFSIFVRYLFFSTIIGLRLGHCFFYEPVYFLTHPLEILKVWKGGLASHGAALGIVIGLFLYVRKYKKSFIWILDRVVIIVCIVGSLVRLGNLMNSEIVGSPSEFKGSFLFVNSIDKYLVKPNKTFIADSRIKPAHKDTLVDGISYTKMLLEVDFKKNFKKEDIANKLAAVFPELLASKKSMRSNLKLFKSPEIRVKTNASVNTAMLSVWAMPRLPSQLFESVFYALLFIILYLLYRRNKERLTGGVFFSSFLVALFVFRFLIEFLKKDQVEFESGMLLNMGQVLSIPFIVVGVVLLIYSLRRKKVLSFSR